MTVEKPFVCGPLQAFDTNLAGAGSFLVYSMWNLTENKGLAIVYT